MLISDGSEIGLRHRGIERTDSSPGTIVFSYYYVYLISVYFLKTSAELSVEFPSLIV